MVYYLFLLCLLIHHEGKLKVQFFRNNLFPLVTVVVIDSSDDNHDGIRRPIIVMPLRQWLDNVTERTII
jgi:hypothetical protein